MRFTISLLLILLLMLLHSFFHSSICNCAKLFLDEATAIAFKSTRSWSQLFALVLHECRCAWLNSETKAFVTWILIPRWQIFQYRNFSTVLPIIPNRRLFVLQVMSCSLHLLFTFGMYCCEQFSNLRKICFQNIHISLKIYCFSLNIKTEFGTINESAHSNRF